METPNFNITFFKGYLSESERKFTYVHHSDSLRFETTYDLSAPVKVTPRFEEPVTLTQEEYASEVARFIGMWTITVSKHLTSFSGFDTVNWVCSGFIIKNKENA